MQIEEENQSDDKYHEIIISKLDKLIGQKKRRAE